MRSYGNRISVWDLDLNNITTFGKEGSQAGSFQTPLGVCTDSAGNV